LRKSIILSTHVGEDPVAATPVGQDMFVPRIQTLEQNPQISAHKHYIIPPMWRNHIDNDQKIAVITAKNLRAVILPRLILQTRHEPPAHKTTHLTVSTPIQPIPAML
jgi:hypothetical protein